MLSGDDDGWAWLKDKARQQGAQPPGAGGAALKPLGAPPPLPGKSAPRGSRTRACPPAVGAVHARTALVKQRMARAHPACLPGQALRPQLEQRQKTPPHRLLL